uniref:RING-type E3 ubiquitin transferase n=1 Tax=Trieres chinensis TaxID=1514140 RepID=A0A7S1ZT87_TRICV|mmetsp:Transcript_32121/g.65603  ORF Transcript_32121/g.65603 Transcript_32121/m.65603 type:complete len:289 (+) Transcript_32121:611-1477(+)
MASIVQCLLRSCLERERDDDDEHDSNNGAVVAPLERRMSRRSSPRRHHRGYLAPGALDDPHEEIGFEQLDDASDCCDHRGGRGGHEDSVRTSPSADSTAAGGGGGLSSPAGGGQGEEDESPARDRGGVRGLRELLRRWAWLAVEDGEADYGSIPGRSRDEDLDRPSADGDDGDFPQITSPSSPLRAASSFGVEEGQHDIIPAIALDEIVMPGSELQKKMSEALSHKLEDMGDECVICLEGFDPTNPRMPTLCGCGENKTYFHLPCLYQWIDQDENCPSCRKRLRWEEF